ncbi:MAG: hypothetical protein A3G33_04400 [Omnitrophica bacterium RIFCSPLOWO2_12_FULL_44_17]|uniref:Uncharacterized protein n=1 Tax=Candidatus Danuiimicrobium aquiferis TaxID=1801832 RepID=A0A1G1KQR4_9BACT|nr:MAG: hypothetical protein A3B72_10610 [Omnitrophica bacterium RIFCSPHIGHO2_02_FULL_45_28]OGW95175.1 MAG: hypothetical protein A3G33_04400 [Omnitrophica bacterium RIFCSPLOWO2_12_FULL_44_17]OGX01680.1 MAG: hypothetical protein A3J12_04035 [Omnitrophica bacterium RIFCSPLOWO2_02_FULL_44_11]
MWFPPGQARGTFQHLASLGIFSFPARLALRAPFPPGQVRGAQSGVWIPAFAGMTKKLKTFYK